ncbi:hypothetical protein KQX54_009737 [Cotesia glomerata]|uniref:Uncharacterized protein n=1 Tax=Cotesia glomerata TaxID=32391 RepID=A0AAV7IEF9_COTGL|nr:hypothetical protein KQX54_009737 [Cotesia glomerata]
MLSVLHSNWAESNHILVLMFRTIAEKSVVGVDTILDFLILLQQKKHLRITITTYGIELLEERRTSYQVLSDLHTKFTIGVSVPLLATNKKGNVVFSAGFQFNYALPWNLTQLQSPSIIPSRHTDDFNLNNIYLSIENLFDRYNWSDGRQCLLRSICELAETPLNRVNTDVLLDVVHLLLTPSEDLPETVNSSHRSIDKLYHRAELLGRSGGDCASSYSGCAESPLKYFTQIVFT